MAASLVQQLISVNLYGDSHLCDNHFFPGEFEPRVTASGRFHKPNYFARGGATIGPNIVATLRRQLVDSKPTIHVIAIGGNNLRRGMRSDRVEEARNTIRETVRECLDLIVAANARFGTQYHHLLVCSIIPSPEHTPEEMQVFTTANQELKTVVQSNPATATFLHMDRFLRQRNRSPNLEFFSQDQIHLNLAGAKKIAEVIFNAINNVRRDQLGLPPRRP